ncbi:MAG: hypothetical protein LBQ78_06980 [Tannerellaceae bacterium]|jgi:hypothetical protein|nr:hypothetical protein [Tannerellaceae bacterium]
MRKTGLLYTILLTVSGWINGQVFIGTEPTGNPVALEVKSTNTGVLIPRISIPDLSLPGPVSSPKTGLLAINTHPANGAGLVFWNGKKWEQIETCETAKTYLLKSGKIANYVAKALYLSTPLDLGKYKTLSLNGLGTIGTATLGHQSYKILATGSYEITATSTVTATSGVEGYYVIEILSGKTVLSRHVGYQASKSSQITCSTTFCGYLAANIEISVQVCYNSDTQNALANAKALSFSVKRLE